jgi:hypothetical protein
LQACRLGLPAIAIAMVFIQMACVDTMAFDPEDRSDRSPDPSDAGDPDYLDLGAAIADAKFLSDAPYQHLGLSVAAAGDVDGDGFGDLVLGAPGDIQAGGEPGGVVDDPGAAFLYLGPFDGEIRTTASRAKLLGTGSNDVAGYVVAAASDLDGDGSDDFLVAAPGFEVDGYRHGRVFSIGGEVQGDVPLAGVEPSVLGEHDFGFAGMGMAEAGDVDGDGAPDLLVGDVCDSTDARLAGAAYLVLGPVAGAMDLALVDAKLTGEEEDDYAGYALSTAGDVDDDGHADFLVGAPNTNGVGPGRAYLVKGPVSGTRSLSEADATFIGEVEGGQAGWAVAGGDDLDGDGVEDFVIGAPIAESPQASGRGVVYVVRGPVGGSVLLADADASLLGDEMIEWIGVSLAMPGDVDGDGAADLLVGASSAAYLITDVVNGETLLSTAGFRFRATWGSNIWQIVAAAGDTNGDGYADFLLGDPYDGTEHQEGGAAYLFHGGERFRWVEPGRATGDTEY